MRLARLSWRLSLVWGLAVVGAALTMTSADPVIAVVVAGAAIIVIGIARYAFFAIPPGGGGREQPNLLPEGLIVLALVVAMGKTVYSVTPPAGQPPAVAQHGAGIASAPVALRFEELRALDLDLYGHPDRRRAARELLDRQGLITRQQAADLRQGVYPQQTLDALFR